MKRHGGFLAMMVLVATLALGGAGAVGAASTVIVTPTNTQGWTSAGPLADTRPGGTVTFVNGDAPAGGGSGSLKLTTDATTTAKAQYMHAADEPLASVTQLSYWTKQINASFAGGDPSYQVVTCLGGVTGGTCNGFTTLVYEPYENGSVIPGTWQQWNVAAGQFWSSRSYTNGSCIIAAGAGGPPFYTLAALNTACPGAVVVAFGVNVGANNPSYNVETDLFNFNGTTYDFEVNSVATNKEQCKNGGWRTFNPPTSPYKNQGQCVSSTNHQDNKGND